MFRSVKPSRAIVHRTSAFSFSNLGRDDKKDTHQKVCVFFVISVHFRCHRSVFYRPDLSAFFLLYEKKKIVRLRRAVGGSAHPRCINFSNLSVLDFSKQKTTCRNKSFFVWRYRPDLNWRMRVLQTLALPLGHGTI